MDMSAFVAPKSDQMNADDLIAGPRTITIERVSGTGNGDQPVAVHYQGDGGKPFKPCKSMRRVMISAWGPDASQYVGRSMTLYRDPKVAFGGMEVGGIRISHMTHIEREMVMALTVTKARRAPYSVKPLDMAKPAKSKADERADAIVRLFEGCADLPAVEAAAAKAKASINALGQLPEQGPFNRATAARSAAFQKYQARPEPEENLGDADMGDAYEPEIPA